MLRSGEALPVRVVDVAQDLDRLHRLDGADQDAPDVQDAQEGVYRVLGLCDALTQVIDDEEPKEVEEVSEEPKVILE